MEIRVPKKKFKELQKLGKEGIVELIRENLPRVELTLKAEKEEFLIGQRKKLKEKIREMEEELKELERFYEMAVEDRETMMKLKEQLEMENAQLRRELEEKRDALKDKA
ncbi:hypothetical protein DRN43_02950 [Thermococci archaeon]|nr:MAG: hypothetical protein DRN43_02950 [Thermococci archaeon]